MANAKIDYNKHIWEGWTVQAFVDELDWQVRMIMNRETMTKPFKTKAELKTWCMDNQPYYKKHIPEVVNHFAAQYNIK